MTLRNKETNTLHCQGLKAQHNTQTHKLHVVFLIWWSSTLGHMVSGPQLPLPSHLQEVCRQHLVSVTIIEGQSGGEAGHGDTVLHASADRPAPRLLNKMITPVNTFIIYVKRFEDLFKHGLPSHVQNHLKSVFMEQCQYLWNVLFIFHS